MAEGFSFDAQELDPFSVPVEALFDLAFSMADSFSFDAQDVEKLQSNKLTLYRSENKN